LLIQNDGSCADADTGFARLEEAVTSIAAVAPAQRLLVGRLADQLILVCFLISGFCSLLYEVLWTRLAFAHFGIITPVLSLVVSVFMLGLGIGSVLGGRLAASANRKYNLSPLYLYAAAEAFIALGAFTVPALFRLSGTALIHAGATGSDAFLFISAACIVVALLPWCIAMGATIPLMMAFVRRKNPNAGESFSFLYAANVLGAATGAVMTAIVLIELLGLSGTYALAAIALGLARALPLSRDEREASNAPAAARGASGAVRAESVLFITGFCSVGMEVCWARDFTFVLLTTIYAFALILATYLIATYLGSTIYRSAIGRNPGLRIEGTVAWLFPLALLPVFLGDPRTNPSFVQPLLSIVPFCAALGFLTPGLIDRFGRGDATVAGRFYAWNILGAILGPLVAGYLLLPLFGIRWAMILLALPLLAAMILVRRPGTTRLLVAFSASAVAAAVAVLISRAYDDGSLFPSPVQVHRDYSASVVAFGTGYSKQLLVNAVHITALGNTDVKVMAHLPMVLQGHPHRALVICLGMGTTFRSLTTWGTETTAVDLSRSVIDSFPFFYPEAPTILESPKAHLIADDGRRYLMRTNERFDIITLDPPPPVEAAGSSLLYSKEFYDAAKMRLAPGGIVAQWLPYTGGGTTQSVALALKESFPYILAFKGAVGLHLIASTTPLRVPNADEFVKRMPLAARKDLVEWEHETSPQTAARGILARQIPFDSLLPAPDSRVPALSDDRPYNEYNLLRRTFGFLI
jgi:predicted membrane-bound spermidine synthase